MKNCTIVDECSAILNESKAKVADGIEAYKRNGMSDQSEEEQAITEQYIEQMFLDLQDLENNFYDYTMVFYTEVVIW